MEKEALASVVYEVTGEYDIPLMVTRGYPSLSFLYSAAEAITDADVPAFLYYIGDHDPSGLDITRSTERRIREFAPEAEIHFERIAVTPEQIVTCDLPTRPTKKTDTRSRNWEGGSVEVDALPGRVLRELVREHIERHVDRDHVEHLEVVEEEERAIVQSFAEQAGGRAA